MKDTPVIMANDFRASEILSSVKIARPGKGKRYPKDKRTGEKYRYIDLVTSFDIEVTKEHYDKGPTDYWSFMYIWQWQFGEICTVIGRTWIEFLDVLLQVNNFLHGLDGDVRMLCWVHNLSFEFVYLSGIWPFRQEDVFATSVHDVLYCRMESVELRCSARLSGYPLEKWGKIHHVDHPKTTDLAYDGIRYPWTPLTPEELRYCINDVICVVECVTDMMHLYGDTLYSIPYTQTGYIRRRIRRALRLWSPDGVRSMQNSLEVYDRLRAAFRGGDTHSNIVYAGVMLGDVRSYDRSSSYPDVMVHCKFPMSRFKEIPPTVEALQDAANHGKCLLFKIGFRNIRLKKSKLADPYIMMEKCILKGYQKPVNPLEDNGRLLKADYVEMTITDIDYDMIDQQYEWEGQVIYWAMAARYGFLPQPMIDVIIDLYKRKTELKGVPDMDVVYVHSKQDINACFGMLVQRVVTDRVAFIDGRWLIQRWMLPGEDPDHLDPDVYPKTREQAYNESLDRAVGSYAWGVWVTAWARYRLHEGINIAIKDDPLDFVYADTDSVKCRCVPDFDRFNNARIRDAMRSGAYATDPKGNVHYMGVFEFEGGPYDQFITLGAKKYAVKYGDVVKITVAGAPKDKGSEQLAASGKGIEDFGYDYVFDENAGKLGKVYQENLDVTVIREGHELRITNCVSLVERKHKIKEMPDYQQVRDSMELWLDDLADM